AQATSRSQAASRKMKHSGLMPKAASPGGNNLREALIQSITPFLPVRCASKPAINPAVGDTSSLPRHRYSCTAPVGKDRQGNVREEVLDHPSPCDLNPSIRMICAWRSLIISVFRTCIQPLFL